MTQLPRFLVSLGLAALGLLGPPRAGAAQTRPALADSLPAAARSAGTLTLAPTLSPPPDTLLARRRRLRLLVAGSALSYGALYAGLGANWYTGEKVPLHWFNDWPEWKQLDKAGHVWGAFHESRGAVDMLRWAGLSEKKALWYGAFAGFALQSPLEFFDGRDPDYGASASDLAANFLGSAGLLGQHLLWREVRLMPKVSFQLSPYARRRPNALGRTVAERLLKDYNGQTYWLSADVGAFLTKDTRWPRWLQPALGYGAAETVFNEPAEIAAAGLRPYRQYYLSLDVDLRRIPTRHLWLKRTFYVLSIFHLPAPALEVNGRGRIVFHPVYF